MSRASTSSRASDHPLALLCLFLSGFAGLVYEVGWIRLATRVFGSTTLAVSTVVAVFFAGLAAGSWLAGRSRVLRPSRAYVRIEIALAGLAVTSPWLFEAADHLFGPLYATLAPTPLAVTRALVVALIVALPAGLMGATLPLFCRHQLRVEHGLGAAIARLYAANTAGAAAGCFAAGFWLIPRLGVSTSVRAAAALNLTAAFLAATRLSDPEAPSDASRAESVAPRRPSARALDRPVVGSLFFLSGFSILGDEVLWTRFSSLLVDEDVHRYTIALGTVLVGIVLGAIAAARLSDDRDRGPARFAALQIAIGLYLLALTHAPPALWASLGRGALSQIALLLLPSVLSGASFPIAMRLSVTRASEASHEVGLLGALNTVGGVMGSLVAGFLCLPLLGLQRSLHAFAGASVLAGLVALLLVRGPTGRRVVAAVTATAAWLAIPKLATTRLPADYLGSPDRLVDFREGRSAHVAVLRTPRGLELTIDRYWQGQSEKNHQIMAAHVPLLLHPAPTDALVVGVGAGLAPSRFLLHDIERLDCVDIEPAVFELIDAWFPSAWLHDPRTHALAEDGNNHLAHTAARYDVISIEVGQTVRTGVGGFYTVDFYQRARQRLAPGGLVSQFLPLLYFPTPLLARAVASFVSVFPDAALWYNRSELLLLGFTRPPTLRRPEVARVVEDLRYAHWGGPQEYLANPTVLAAGFLLDGEGLRALAGDAAPFRDDPPELDFEVSALRESGSPFELDGTLATIRQHLADPRRIAPWLQGRALARALAIREENLADLTTAPILHDLLVTTSPPERRLAALEGAVAIHPRSVEIHTLAGETALALGRPDLALDHYRRGTAIAPKDPDALLGRAFAEQQLGRGDAAMATYRALLELREDPAALNNLGAALAARGELVEARRLFERVLAATSPATSREAAHRREAEQNLAIIEQLMRR